MFAIIAFVVALLGAALGALVAATLAYVFLRASYLVQFQDLVGQQAEAGVTLDELQDRIAELKDQVDRECKARRRA